ncbi:MAG: hypothetical protein LAP85_21985 [Acidobacteriia bacterium]|nr:hypothetical protein [Terriglobia bacterium]
MRMTIEVEMSNAAFTEDGPGSESHEAARILRDLAGRIECHPHFSPGLTQALHDINGNNVGRVDVRGDRVQTSLPVNQTLGIHSTMESKR